MSFYLYTISLGCFIDSYFNGAFFCQYCKVQIFQPIVLFWEMLVRNPAILWFSLSCWILNFFHLLYALFTIHLPKGDSPFLMCFFGLLWKLCILTEGCCFKLYVFLSFFPILLTLICIFFSFFYNFQGGLSLSVKFKLRFCLFCPFHFFFFFAFACHSLIVGRNGMRV